MLKNQQKDNPVETTNKEASKQIKEEDKQKSNLNQK